jgi:hypothetical protein
MHVNLASRSRVTLFIDTPLTVKSWDAQKRVLENADDQDEVELGFATFS